MLKERKKAHNKLIRENEFVLRNVGGRGGRRTTSLKKEMGSRQQLLSAATVTTGPMVLCPPVPHCGLCGSQMSGA